MSDNITFNFNPTKALNAVLYMAQKNGGRVNVYNMLKMIFEADKTHLNTYGNPLTGDTYIRMPYGTVPSYIYNFTKKDALSLGALNLENYPFDIEGHDLVLKGSVNLEVFSKSELKALDHGFEEYKNLSFEQVKVKNHKEKCWLDGFDNQVIPYQTMIENPEILEYLNSIDPKEMVL